MERASIDETKKVLDEVLARPIPGKRGRVSEAVVDDEMALFRQAQASNGR